MSSTKTPTSKTYYLGIRHHGVGSATRLLSVLDALKPTKVLIEGASDCSDLLPLLAHHQMKPPVALLAYATESPDLHFYYPFTEFSPEYQATLWAVKHHVEVAFIDLPVSVKLAKNLLEIEQFKEQQALKHDKQNDQQNDKQGKSETEQQIGQTNDTPHDVGFDESPQLAEQQPLSDDDKFALQLSHDPIGILANLAGYEDGEDWWNDIIEQTYPNSSNSHLRPNPKDPKDLVARKTSEDSTSSTASEFDEANVTFGEGIRQDLAVFNAVANAMLSLRQRLIDYGDITESDNEREAYMRQQIASVQKSANDDEVIVVVCGAWHVPALDPTLAKQLTDKDGKAINFTAKTDTAIIKNLPKKLAPSKVKTTWIPWTSPRLASQSGYGAGVKSPMWYLHLWQSRDRHDHAEHWLAKVAQALREQGQVISTASVIEAVRLSQSLASVRQRPSVGFEELTESAIACLCFGEPILWRQIEASLLLGNQVGQIPDDMPLAPLLEDLQRLQKQTKLAPESLAKEISLDLRSDAGLKKSQLLHRLRILGVNWGKLLDSGSSRGTFREKWLLEWQPEFSVELVENLVYGNTIEQASNNKLAETMTNTQQLSRLVSDVQLALQANLPHATDTGLGRLGVLANQTDSTDELLSSLSPLIHLERYGTARTMALEQVGELVRQLTIKVAIALPYAIRQIDNDIAERYHTLIKDTHHALLLGELDDDVMAVWWQAMGDIAHGLLGKNQATHTHSLLIGLCNRLLYQAEKIDNQSLEDTLQRALSPAIATAESAQFFAGFFQGATQTLLFDEVLLGVVKQWLIGLNGEEFVEYLPLFRRVFAGLDALERKHLLERVTQGKQRQTGYTPNAEAYPLWQKQLGVLEKLFNGEQNWVDG
ncbi:MULTISPECIES: DUF5682 family protein [unclassified Moraxella]|uniref:DUF5682 family protein n=1 Tax=unclassified Moraxella TaxID=2685852 RepID=UPI003AF9649D